MKKEYWKPVVGFEGLYEVSSLGRVKSLNYGCTGKEGILKNSKTSKYGHLCVYLYKDKKRQKKYIHILVAEAFIPNPENKPCVDHIDGNPQNNCVDNLRWVTHKENNNNPITKKRYSETKKGNTNHPKKPLVQLYKGEVINVYNCAYDTEKYGFNHRSVGKCCRCECKSHKGYQWRYVEENENLDH